MCKYLFHKKPRIMFDTNTYRHIIDCNADNQNTAMTYTTLHNMIKNNEIDAFLSETLFTIEAIQKTDRLAFMSEYNPQIETITQVHGNSAKISTVIGPDDRHKVDFNGTGPLRSYFQKALELGFKIIRLPRIGGIMNAEIDDSMLYKLKGKSFGKYNEKAGEVGQKIEDRGAGEAHIRQILSRYDDETKNIFKQFDLLFQYVNQLPLSQRRQEIKKVAKAIAELSDGDSVASSIGLKCAAFCTNDRAVGAGTASVFSADNVAWLKTEYGFNKLSPTELVEFLRH